MFIPFIDIDRHYKYFMWSQVTDEYLSPHYSQEIPVFDMAHIVIKGCHAPTE